MSLKFNPGRKHCALAHGEKKLMEMSLGEGDDAEPRQEPRSSLQLYDRGRDPLRHFRGIKIAPPLEKDLTRFKEFIEDRGEETGAWRGEIHQEKK